VIFLSLASRPSRRSGRVVERELVVARALWLLIVSGFFEPLFYLLSIGVGIGHLVGDVTIAGHSYPYRDFVAPAMLAAAGMNGSVYATTFNMFFKLKYEKTYDAMVVTPLSVGDIVMGEVGWALARGAFYTVAFLVVMAALGLVQSWWALLAAPAALLIGFCFAGIGTAATTFIRTWKDFDFVLLGLLPMFLFSATFSPLSAYPSGVRVLVRVTPLYQGVALCRGLILGQVGASLVGHALYLAVVGSVCLVIAIRRFGRILLG
jgi:lipooligosaccharide transport system permease protein